MATRNSFFRVYIPYIKRIIQKCHVLFDEMIKRHNVEIEWGINEPEIIDWNEVATRQLTLTDDKHDKVVSEKGDAYTDCLIVKAAAEKSVPRNRYTQSNERYEDVNVNVTTERRDERGYILHASEIHQRGIRLLSSQLFPMRTSQRHDKQ